MNYWDNLPCELQHYITAISVSPIIQNIWRRKCDCNRYSVNIARKYLDEKYKINPLLPKTAFELEYCIKHAFFCKNKDIWNNYFEMIEQSLQVNIFMTLSELEYSIQYYRRTNQAKYKLKKQLNISSYGAPNANINIYSDFF